jgi:hypothetical protein
MKKFSLFILVLLAFFNVGVANGQSVGIARAVMEADAGPAWQVVGHGYARTLRELGALVDANPSADVIQLRRYNGGKDGQFTQNVISSIYTGIFDCQNFPIININIYSTAGLPDLPVSSSVSFFNEIAGGTLKNCDMQGTVSQLSTSLNGDLQTYRVAGIVGVLDNATVDNVKGNFAMTINGYFNYNGILFADVRGTTAMTNLECQGSQSLSLTANNNLAGCIPSFFQGTLDTMRVHNLSVVVATGESPGETQQCSTPPCSTSGAYLGAAIGALGYSGTQCATATNITVESTVSLQNTTNDGQGETGGVTGPVFCGTLTNSSNAGSVSGSRNVGGVVSSLRYADGSSSPSRVSYVYNTGAVTGTVTALGGVAAVNAGYLHHAYSTGTVTGATASSCGTVLGYNYSGGKVDHVFGWGTTYCNAAAGGTIGRNSPSSGTIDQAYTLSAVNGMSAIAGAAGVCANIGSITNVYWNTTTSGLSVGCGTNAAPGAAITGLTDAAFLGGLPTNFDGDWLQNANAGGYPYLANMPIPAAPAPPNPRKYLVLTPGSTSPLDLSVSAPDFNCANNIIRALGSGGNGGTADLVDGSGGGGGGGAYSSIRNFCPATPSTPITFSVAAGGSGAATFTYFSNVTTLKAMSGGNGAPATNALGGAGSEGAGTFVRNGGNSGLTGSGARSGGGGGGAGGPNGAGKIAGDGFGNILIGGGGGGGAADNGTIGVDGTAGVFTGSMAGTTLTVSAVTGTMIVGAVVTSASAPANTVLLSAISGTEWLVSTSATFGSEAMTSTTVAGYTAGGAGSTSTATPGAAGSNGSGGGGGSSSQTAASVGGAGSCAYDGSGTGSGSGGGGGGGLGVTLATGAAGGNGGCSGGGGGGGGRGITTGGAGGTGGDGSIVIEWTP